ncbi:hypothetical protein GTO10_00870, partial [Candidatus Saccharibacteria bacterium]|nr:hypothetical protein [Candidatus Saccharibacteria bacterium]
MADLVSYTIPNWDQYNPRNDRKNYKWFRFQNDFFIDPKIFGLTAEGKLLYQYLLCEASKRGDGAGVVNLELAASLTRINIKKIRDLLAEMVETKLIDGSLPSSCRRKDADGIATYETNERTNERGHHGVTPRDLERVYFLYPRKQGKTNGLKKIAKEINTPELLEQFETAVKNYAAHCETGITSKKYIKHFDT